ncbi:MAG: ISAs1 family transposase [Moorea sp. SIOASIH]|nr:ISAs1 family transposase [Moorena sp. SIOASIH]
MGMMSGYWGYRQLGRFVERHRRELINILQIPNARVPSYSAIRRVMVNLDYEKLQIVFNEWSKQSGALSYGELNSPRVAPYSVIPSNEWISLDGKSLKNTVINYDHAQQNFINCVSAFSHQRRLVLGVKMMENKQESEIPVVRDLIELLDLTGVVFTFRCDPWRI